MRTSRSRCLMLALGLAFSPLVAEAQHPLALDAFDGWETWPLVRPGDLDLSSVVLAPVRIAFAGFFPGAGGFGVPPLDSLTMWMDVLPATFHGKPALWVQWTSSGVRTRAAEAPALDAILVDRATFRLLFRVARSGPAKAWAGAYDLIHATEDSVVQVSVGDDGAAAKHVLDRHATYFDFATYPFLFPFLNLRPGLGLRLAGYDFLGKQEEILAVHVAGRTTVTDARGTTHDVWQVDVMPSHRATLISFYVTPTAPYFYGWDYRLVRDGSTAIKLTYRGWVSTAIP
jgi:hypothetical protein